jgi:flavin-binding protein dodecin
VTRGVLRLLGSALIAYGLAGIVILAVIGLSVGRPLADMASIGSSVSEQQAAALEALDRASDTIDETAAAVRNMETSLTEAHDATQRSATLSRGMAQTMYGLAIQMQITILGIQPLIGLAPSFEQSGAQLDLLAADIDSISTALDANREDTVAVADGLDELGASIGRLRDAVANGPDLTTIAEGLVPVQLGLLALIAWLLVAAVGSVLAGLLCWRASRLAGRGSIEPTA